MQAGRTLDVPRDVMARARMREAAQCEAQASQRRADGAALRGSSRRRRQRLSVEPSAEAHDSRRRIAQRQPHCATPSTLPTSRGTGSDGSFDATHCSACVCISITDGSSAGFAKRSTNRPRAPASTRKSSSRSLAAATRWRAGRSSPRRPPQRRPAALPPPRSSSCRLMRKRRSSHQPKFIITWRMTV